MKRIFLQSAIVAAQVLIHTACSEVGFTPGPQKATSEDDDSSGRGLSGTMYETFFVGSTDRGGKVDILFVVDNSTSMVSEQQKVAERMDSFIDSLQGLDWQIGITTTDVSDGTYGIKGELLPFSGTSSHILTNKVVGFEQKFKETIVRNETIDCVSICPSSTEQPIRAAMLAIDKRNTENSGFFRSDANLAVVVLSDEDEMSDGSSLATTPEEFMDHVEISFAGSKRATVFGLVIVPEDTACYNAQTTTAYYGTFVAELTEMTGGVLGSICDDDYAKNLTNIGDRVQELVNHVILSKLPVVDSVEITFTPALDVTWSLSGRKVIFSKKIPAGTKVDVSYNELD